MRSAEQTLTERVADAEAWFGEFHGNADDGGRVRLAMMRPGAEWTEMRGFRRGFGPFAGHDHPGMLHKLARAVVNAADAGEDVYACPYLHDGSRRKGGAVARRHLHADIDGPLDLDKARQVGAMVVASGSTDPATGRPHAHIYLRLSESVPSDVHETLSRALGEWVGGRFHDRSKATDDNVLRPPGTLNHKRQDDPRPVSWLIRPDDPSVRTWEPSELAAVLGLEWPLSAPGVDDAPGGLEGRSDATVGGCDEGVGAGRGEVYSARMVASIVADLDASASWPTGHRDEHGRGWEKLQADASCRLARLALADWSPMTMAEAEAAYLAHAPVGGGWTARDRAAKWGDQRRRAELHGPLDLPANEFAGLEIEFATDNSKRDDSTAEERTGTSWRAVDLIDIVTGLCDGTLVRLRPTVGQLSLSDNDAGQALFYRGKVNGDAGESGCGKSMLAQVAGAQEMAQGRAVVYIDFEDSALGVVARLLDMGVPAETITQHFHYLSPTEGLTTLAWVDLSELLDEVAPSLVIIDSTGEGLSMAGRNPNADEEVAAWFRSVPRRIADHPSGPAVVVLDHVTKADDGGLWPIGSQRKRAAINGAQYMQRLAKPFSRDHAGSAVLTVAKDRHGHYRTGQKVAQLHVTPAGDGRVHLDLVHLADSAPAEGGSFRATVLMERVSRYLETHPGAADRTARQVRTHVDGKEQALLAAADMLVVEGFVKAEAGPRNATVYTSVKPFREADGSGHQS